MGAHFSLSGGALDLLAGKSDAWGDVPCMVDQVHTDLQGHSTRVDLAFDDKVGLLDLDVIGQALHAGDYVSRWRNPPAYVGKVGAGVTWYLGSSRSDSQLVIYDKLQERKAQGHADQVEGMTHWVRVELRLRRERAQAAAEKLRERGSDVWSFFAGVLKGMVDFKERGESDRKTRWDTVGWWDAFLGFAAKARLVVERKEKTLDDVRSWVLGQVAPSLAVLERGMGFNEAWSFLYLVAKEGHERLGPRHRLLLQSVGAGTGG
jgi:phage replication initiation protein